MRPAFIFYLQIAPGGVEAVYFPILPTTLGRVKVTVRAQSATEADELTKDLLVEVNLLFCKAV